jgi:O-antigen biosynthesis protein
MRSEYDTEPEPTSENNSHAMIVELVGHDKRVLDVGTATGYVAELLAERGCQVTGIEVDLEAAREAEKHCKRVITGDIEILDLQRELGDSHFDVIVFGDVLEHLRNPWEALKRFKPFLDSEGYVVASIPNVAHGSVRLALLQGKFQYRSLGLLDDTHLRFFTRESIERMFSDAGLLVTDLKRTRLGTFNTEVAVDRELLPRGIVETVLSAPESQTYQFIVKASPTEKAEEEVGLANRNFWLSEQLAERDRTINSQRQELRSLEESKRNAELAEHNSRLSEQLAEKDRTIYEQERKLRNLEHLQSLAETRAEQLYEKEREAARLTQEVTRLNHQLARLTQSQGGSS